MRRPALVSLFATLATLGALARVAHAGREDDYDAVMGFELGPTLGASGALGDRVQPSFGGNFRIGMRFGRAGVELRVGARGAELDRTLTMDAIGAPAIVAYRAGVAYYPVVTRWFQLLAHGELSFGGVGGTHDVQKPCALEEECPGGVRVESESVSFRGYGYHAGLTAQLHLRKRHHHQHAALWSSLTASHLRFRFDTQTVSGGVLELAFGVAVAF
ncbi:MAG: hypothetical protein KIT31_02070 [Deltaproteobacteria bacterium]|nr:hypothetical protein [Deltaproteobacteria bacterium]